MTTDAAKCLNGGDSVMCYNCGCQMPNNDMGKSENITNKKFDEAAKAPGISQEPGSPEGIEPSTRVY